MAIALLFAAARPSAAQQEQRAPQRVFGVRQYSYWMPAGGDSSRVAIAETLFVARVAANARLTAPTLDMHVGPADNFGGVTVRRSRRSDGAGITPTDDERNDTFGYPDPSRAMEIGSMLAEAGLWLGDRKPGGTAAGGAITLHAGGADFAIDVTERRRERNAGPRHASGQHWTVVEADVDMTIRAATQIEQHLEDGGVRADVQLSGPAHERYLYLGDAALTDSLVADGRLSGRIIYQHRSGRSDTVSGTWVFRRIGSWRPDADSAAEAQMQYFVVHGRNPEGEPPPRMMTAFDALFGRELNVDSLARLRAVTASPLDRVGTEAALRRALASDDSLNDRADRAAAVASGDALMVTAWLIDQRYGGHGALLDRRWAEGMATLLADEHRQREMALDREEIFATAISRAEGTPGVNRASAPLLLDAARRARDPLGRDMILLLAYMADPAAALPLIEQLSDSVEGFGPIAREYTRGNSEVMAASWGLRRDDQIFRDAVRFPGLDTSAARHAAYLRRPGRTGLWIVEQWFAARGLDARVEFRRRFQTDPLPSNRLVWARYLTGLGDSTPEAWLRTTAAAKGPLRNAAIQQLRLKPDSVTEDSIVTTIQDLMLDYVTGGSRLRDTLGSRLEGFIAHDESQGRWYLVTDLLAPALSARWAGRFTLMTEDSLGAIAQRDGLQMAVVVSSVTRTADQYEVSVGLHPYMRRGEMCLCGGGSNFILERRDGRWVVISLSQWIS